VFFVFVILRVGEASQDVSNGPSPRAILLQPRALLGLRLAIVVIDDAVMRLARHLFSGRTDNIARVGIARDWRI
jgi:hypothetical protein